MRRLFAIGWLLMALSAKVLSFNIGTGAAASTVTVTPGFETQFAILFWSGRTASTDGNGAGTHFRGVGILSNNTNTGLTFGAVASRSADAGGNAIADASIRTDACILEQADGAMAGWADVQSVSSTQVVFEILDQFATDLRVTGIFFGGSDITHTVVGAFTATGAAPVDQSVDLSFAPSLLFVLGSGAVADAPTTAADSEIEFGVARAASSSFSYAGASNDGAANMVTESYLRDNELIAAYDAGITAVSNRATFVSFSGTGGAGNGFTINWAARGIASRHIYLAVGGTFQSAIGSFLTQTDTTTDMTGSTSFTPKGMLFVSHNKAQNTAGGLSAHDKWSMGAATSTSEQHCQAIADRDGNTSSFVSMAVEQDHIYVNMDEVNRTLQGSANLTAVSSSGFTARMTDADPAQGSVCWLALGDAAAAGRTTKNTRAWPLGMEVGMNWRGNLQ